MSNNALRTARAAGASQRPGSGHDVEPLAHVLLALAISVASLLLACWTLWPDATSAALPGGEVVAADTRHALPAEPTAAETAPTSSRRSSVPAQPAALVVEEAAESATLTGNAVDEWAHPVPHAEIWIEDGAWRLATLTDHTGRFVIEDEAGTWRARVEEGAPLRLVARAAGHGPSLVAERSALDSSALTLVLRGLGAALRVDVRGVDGRAIEGARLTLGAPRDIEHEGESVALMPTPSLHSDARGEVLFEGLEPGERELTLECDGYSSCTGFVELREGELTERVIQLYATARLHGQVLRMDGGESQGVVITVLPLGSVQRFTTCCDADGRFELLGLPAGDVRLVAETCSAAPPLRASAELRLRAGETAVWQPTLAPVDVIRGRLTAFDGAPLAGWRVELEGPAAKAASERPTLTDADGYYEVPRVPTFNGTRLLLFHPQARYGIPSRVISRPHLGDDIDVELDEGEDHVSWAFGRMLRHDGTPANAQPLVIQRISDRFSVNATIGQDGSFSTPALPPGEYAAILPLHGRGWTQDVSWTIDGRQPFDAGLILLPQTGELALLTSDDDRNAETHALRFDLLRPGVGANFALPVMIGAFQAPQLLQLAPGDYLMQLSDQPELAPVQFTIESGETTPVELPASE